VDNFTGGQLDDYSVMTEVDLDYLWFTGIHNSDRYSGALPWRQR